FSFFPSNPPAALISSIASAVPLCDDWPKLALPPVSEANSPTGISPWAKSAPLSAKSAQAQRRIMEFGMDLRNWFKRPDVTETECRFQQAKAGFSNLFPSRARFFPTANE